MIWITRSLDLHSDNIINTTTTTTIPELSWYQSWSRSVCKALRLLLALIGSGLGLGLGLVLALVSIGLKLGWGRKIATVVYICPSRTENNTEHNRLVQTIQSLPTY